MIAIEQAGIEGRVRAPASKSMMQRAVAAAALCLGTSEITRPSLCNDGLSAIACARALGAEVTVSSEKVTVKGRAVPVGKKLDCGESGLCMRMFAPIAATFDTELELIGKGSLLARPVGMLESTLRELDAMCKTNRGKPPVAVRGPIHGGKLEVDGSQSSQFVSGLLMALPICKEDSVLKVKNLKSKPYVAMTLELLQKFGVKVKVNERLEEFAIKGGQQYSPAKYEVEGDWSGAAFLLVAGAIAGSVTVEGLQKESRQADKVVIDALEKAGAAMKVSDRCVFVEKGKLAAFDFDATDCPDLFPPLAVLACSCKGTSKLKGAERLKGKESDRAATLASELGKLGAKIAVNGDEMAITGAQLHGGQVDSHHDHRIAMACAVAALNCHGKVEIKNEECVSKSYPQFFEDLKSLKVRK